MTQYLNSGAKTAIRGGTLNISPCPVCGAAGVFHRRMPIDSKTFRPTPFGLIVRCTGCSLMFVSPRPSAEETEKFYVLETYYTRGKTHFVDRRTSLLDRVLLHLAWRADRGTTLYAELTARVPLGGRVLDIGCGGGELVKALAEAGYHSIGVERDAASLSRVAGSAEILEGTAENLPSQLQPSSFDAVVFSHVLEHLVDPLRSMKNAAKLLKPGGLLICEVPNNESIVSRESGLAWEHLDIPRHINFFTQNALSRMIEAAGLKVNHCYFSGYCRYFAPSYAATEQRIADSLRAVGVDAELASNWSASRAWRLLAKTVGAAAALKYDSVGIIAARSL